MSHIGNWSMMLEQDGDHEKDKQIDEKMVGRTQASEML